MAASIHAILVPSGTATATFDGTTANVANLYSSAGRDKMLVQVEISDAASVVIKGRLSPDHAWAVLDTITASGIYSLDRVPEAVATITGNTGTVFASVRSD